MDPFSIATGVLGLVQVADGIVTAINQLRRYRDLPDLVFCLRDDIDGLSSVLRQLNVHLQHQNTNIGPGNEFYDRTRIHIMKTLKEIGLALKRLEATYSKSPAKAIVRTSFWKEGNGQFKEFRQEIRDVKLSLSVMLGHVNVQELKQFREHVAEFVIGSIKSAKDTQEIVQKNQGTLNSIRIAFQHQFQHLGNPSEALQGEQHQAQSRNTAPAETESSTDVPSRSAPATRITPLEQHLLRHWCPCQCHVKKQLVLRAPGPLESMLGTFFITYHGLPVSKQQCNFVGCQHERGTAATIEYRSPRWLTAKNTKLQVEFLPNLVSQYRFATFNRVTDDSQSIVYAMRGNIEGLKYLFLRHQAGPRDVSDSRGYSLVRWALYGGMHNYSTVNFLIKAGAIVDEESYDNVWDFIFRGKCSATQRMELKCITDGKDRNWIDDQNFPVIHRIVLGMSSKSLSSELEENPLAVYYRDAQNRTALDWAAARAQLSDVADLIKACRKFEDHESVINNMDITGRTAVLHAVDSHNERALKLILEAGGKANPVYPKGVFRSSPLTAAGFSGKSELLKLLLGHEAEVNAANPEGLTALHSVAQTPNTECAKLLIAAGASLNALSKDGQTPLTIAITRNNHVMLKSFIECYYEYETRSCVAAPALLAIVAKNADVKTLEMLTQCQPLKTAYDLSSASISTSRDHLRERPDHNDILAHAFEDLVDAALSEADEVRSIESALESMSFYSARSSFHSEISDALSRLHSLQNSPIGLQGTWTTEAELVESPTSPLAASTCFGSASCLAEKGALSPTVPRVLL